MAVAVVKPFYTVAEAAQLLRLGRTHLFEEIRRGRLASIRCGRARRIPAEWLDDYRELLKTEAAEEVCA